MSPMSSRASGGALAASLITAAIVGFGGGAYFGSQSGGDTPTASETTTGDSTTPVGETPADGETPPATETPAGDGTPTLTAAQTSVAANERIDLTGTIDPPAEGVVLNIQRSVDGGDWEDFPEPGAPLTTTTNADGAFSTYVTTGRSGTNAFRVVRADDDSVVSNEVQVTVS
jgi:hypothetical protein